MRVSFRSANPLLRQRDGRLFLAAQALDSISIGFSGVVLPWLVLSGGGSHAAAGLVYPVTILPYVLLGLPAGALADRLPRRAVMLGAHALQAAFGTVIPLWAIAGQPPLAIILASGFVIGAGRVFADAAAFGAVASVVGADEFVGGQATLSAAWSIGLFAGPALGGAMIGLVGAAPAMAVEAGAFALATLLISGVRRSFEAPPGGAQRSGAIREGFEFILRDRAVRTYTAVSFCSLFAVAGVYALLVPLFRDDIGLGSGATGWLLAATALASALSTLVVGPLSRRFGGARVGAVAMLAAPFAIAGLGLATGFGTALAALFPYSLLAWGLSVIWIGERQRRVPERLQGRVGISGRMVTLAGVSAGAAVASALAGAMSVGDVYLLMAAAGMAVALVGAPLVWRAATS